MHGVAALLAAAAAAHLLARALGAPAIPLLLLAGLALSSLAPPPQAIIADALVLGASFLLFTAGLELDPRRVHEQRSTALRIGMLQFAVLGVLGFMSARVLGMGIVEAGYVALALTASSTLVGVRLLQRRQQIFEPFGRLVLGVLLLQDVLVLLAIPLVTELASSPLAAAEAMGGLALLGGMAWAVRRWLSPLLERLTHDEEAVLLVALSALFLFSGVADALGLPVVVGAFLAGVSLSRFPVSGMVRPEMAPIGDFFAAVFFTALGAVIRLPTWSEVTQAAALTLLVVGVTPPLVAWVAERRGLHARPALEAGLLLSQTSEISLVIVLYGMMRGDVTGSVFMVIAMVTLATMLLTPLLVAPRTVVTLVRLHPSRHRPPLVPPAPGHVLLLGSGASGMPLLGALRAAGRPVTVVEDDPVVLERLAEAGVYAIRGDASDPEVLGHARIDRAGVVVSTIRRPRDNQAALDLARRAPVLVRVFEEEDAAWVRAQGGIPIVYADAAADAFLAWYDRGGADLDARLEARLSR